MGGTRTLPTGTVTFLMTDVEGSTRHWQRDPDAMQHAEARHREILHTAVAEHGGALPEEQGEGDSTVAAFSSARAAIEAALTAQRRLAGEAWATATPIKVRMAVNTGEARLRDERNYAGESIIRTARLRSLAAGGQVLVSRAAAESCADLAEPAELRSLGEARLKDLRRPEHVYQLCHPDLVDTFPPLRGVEAYPNNLPVQLSSFVGREADLAQIHALVEDVRLLTLTGSGGCGKTRLALQVAADRLTEHPEGVWYVELAPLGDADAIARTLAAALGLSVPADLTPLDAILDELADRSVLLVIDNCEHLLAGAADVINTLLARLPAVRILATSRQPLNLPAETTWRVPSLGVPADAQVAVERFTQFDAVRLFVDRALQVRPDFAVTNANAPVVAAICAALDGIPLAIELAAARVRSLPVDRIAGALEDRFRLLSGGSQVLPDRQQTLRASVEWSHDLLTGEQRRVFRRLSQFAGSFDLPAVEAVAVDDTIDGYAVFDLLAELVDRSLVLFDADEGRYRLLETMKQFGHGRLAEHEEVETVRQRHAAHYAALVEQEAPNFVTRDQVGARRRLGADHENLRLSLEWWHQTGDGDRLAAMASSLVFYWLQTARFHEGGAWLDRAVTAAPGTVTAARSLWGRAYLSFYFGDYQAASDFATEAEVLGRAVDDPLTVARAIDVRADVTQLADPLAGVEPLTGALALAEETGDVWTISDLMQKVAFSMLFVERHDEVIAWLERSRTVWQPTGNPFFAGWHHFGIAWVQESAGDPAAHESARLARRNAAASGDPQTESAAIWLDVATRLRLGDLDGARAAVVDAAADFERRHIGGIAPVIIALGSGMVDIAEGDTAGGVEQVLAATEIARAEGAAVLDAVWSAQALGGLWSLGDIERLEATARHVAATGHQIGCTRWVAVGSEFLSAVALSRGDPAVAMSHLNDAFTNWGDQFDPARSEALRLAAWAFAQSGDAGTAHTLLVAAQATDDAAGWHTSRHAHSWIDATLEAIGTDIPTAGKETISLDEAAALAMRGRGQRLRPSSGWPSLTPTELQVAGLVADGLTNPAIGERLFMSRSTVKTHLAHIFTKLDITSRAELASIVATARPA